MKHNDDIRCHGLVERNVVLLEVFIFTTVIVLLKILTKQVLFKIFSLHFFCLYVLYHVTKKQYRS